MGAAEGGRLVRKVARVMARVIARFMARVMARVMSTGRAERGRLRGCKISDGFPARHRLERMVRLATAAHHIDADIAW